MLQEQEMRGKKPTMEHLEVNKTENIYFFFVLLCLNAT